MSKANLQGWLVAGVVGDAGTARFDMGSNLLERGES